ncbi:MAG: DNA mismatch repair protein MutS [Heliobacteriaceae bacterium]|nr:DNA mismatch repair protein MutS [Heliobacteriaceae bacterium]
MKAVTPMMRQYKAIKCDYPDALLFFRLGDFYEMFGPDAVLASRELEITLTGRDAGLDERVPMCGVPYHAAPNYISRLVQKGYKVAICEQVEDPATAKGIVKREVVRVVTPGTLMDTNLLEEKANYYLLSVAQVTGEWGVAAVDVLTGNFLVTRWPEHDFAGCQAEISRLNPKELLIHPGLAAQHPEQLNRWEQQGIIVTVFPPGGLTVEQAITLLKTHFGVSNLAGFGCADWPGALLAAALNLRYVQETQKATLVHITRLRSYSTDQFMYLDPATRRNLELTQTIREGSRRGSLLAVIDQTITAMGGRLLKQWLEQPLVTCEAIRRRQQVVAAFVAEGLVRDEVRIRLKDVYDLERLAGKVAYGSVNGRDLLGIAASLEAVSQIVDRLTNGPVVLARLATKIDPLPQIVTRIYQTLVDQPPPSVRDGELIRPGFDPQVDQLREAATSGKEWLTRFERQEKERTGIRSLKVGFNKVFGYYIEVTRTHLANVPENYIRKQTLVNCERYITTELKSYEEKILGAEERLTQLEYQLFLSLRDEIIKSLPAIQETARQIARLDIWAALARLAVNQGYVCPEIHEDNSLLIRGGKHPVVEAHLGPGVFVPNDTIFDDNQSLLLITGPNMAGKSTYMRQVALLVLMAQIGSFIPAEEARIGLVDRIFTRVGAADDLASGQSTFMVEMTEVAHILHHASPHSLVVLDEVGRGTGTYDGMAIAWAVVEAIHRLGTKALFATHYHELIRLEERLPGVRCYNVAIRESGDDIIFLHQVRPGGVDKSYGIQVARLAGLPSVVITRAKTILNTLSKDIGKDPDILSSLAPTNPEAGVVADQLALFPGAQMVTGSPPQNARQIAQVMEEIVRLEINRLTPLEALNRLARFQQKLQRG